MPDWVRRPSPAMIVALLALFVALGGTGYAVTALPKNSVGQKQIRKAAVTGPKIKNNTIQSSDIRDATLLGRDLRTGTLGPREIAESKLGPVPHAIAADTLGGLTAPQLKVTCAPFPGTAALATACIEINARAANSWGQADAECQVAGRRLPSYDELIFFFNGSRPLSGGGEWTRNVSESNTTPGQPNALVLLTPTGSMVTSENAAGPVPHAFRCVAAPSN